MSAYIDPRAKLMQHVDRLAAIKDGRKPPPVNVEIDLSNRCNLGCASCHFAYVHSRGPLARFATHQTGDLMETTIALRLIEELKAFGVRSITWTGGGEPTLHPDFDEILGRAHELELPQGLYTNGTGISPLRASLLKQYCKWVYVSLDRHTKAGYRAYKRVDALDRAVDGIRNLVRASGQATVGVGYLLDADNYRDVADMAEFGLSLDADYVQFRPAIEFDASAPGKPKNTEWVSRAIETLEMFGKPAGVEYDIDRFYDLRDWLGHPYACCHWTQLQAVATPDARVWTCVNRRGFDGDELGDLHDESFPAIWRRSESKPVDANCRLMCRGYIPNRALNEMMSDRPHKEFI